MSVFVIGEMASAHDGELYKAKQLVDAAVTAGCNAVKVQFWSDADRLADRRKVPPHYRDIYRRYQIPEEWLSILKDYCGDRIEFMATCFLPEDVATVSPFVTRFKVSAFESHAQDLLKETIAYADIDDRIMIVSVNDTMGISPWLLSNIGIHDVIMYTVTAYPAPLRSINLSSILRIAAAFYRSNGGQPEMGYSDHSGDVDMGAYAVCALANVIEVHMALTNTDAFNPDGGSFAHRPVALSHYVNNVRKAEIVFGSWQRRVSKAERDMKPYHVVTTA